MAGFVRTPPPASRGPVGPLDDVRFVSARVGFLAAFAGQFAGEGRIERTDDGGNTWRTVWVRRHWSVRWFVFVGRRGFAGANDGRQRPFLLRSADDGLRWTAVRMRMPHDVRDNWPSLDVHYLDARRAYAVSDPSSFGPLVFLRSDDGGVTWRHSRPRHPVDAQFLTPKLGFAADGGIWRTDDGGTTWRRLFAPSVWVGAVQFLDARHGFAAGGYPSLMERAPSKVLYATEDGGATWQLRYANGKRGYHGGGDPFARLHFVDTQRGWATTGECKCCPSGPCAGQVLTTSDGGRSWRQSWNEVELSFVGARRAWALPRCDNSCAVVWRTSDAGRSWQPLAAPGALSFAAVGAVGRTLSLVTWDGAAFTSRDDGRTWSLAPPAAPRGEGALPFAATRRGLRPKRLPRGGTDIVSVAFASDSVGYLAEGEQVANCVRFVPLYAGRVWATRDAGATWRRMSVPFRVVALGAQDGLVAATGIRSCVGVLGVSDDGGRSWRIRRVPADCRPSVAADASIWLSCGLLSRDRGRTWTRFHPVSWVAGITADEAWGTSAVSRSSFPRLWHSTDGGRTWREVWARLPTP